MNSIQETGERTSERIRPANQYINLNYFHPAAILCVHVHALYVCILSILDKLKSLTLLTKTRSQTEHAKNIFLKAAPPPPAVVVVVVNELIFEKPSDKQTTNQNQT